MFKLQIKMKVLGLLLLSIFFISCESTQVTSLSGRKLPKGPLPMPPYKESEDLNIFIENINYGDLESAYTQLVEWESRSPLDPEMFTSWFNYYVIQSFDLKNVSSEELPPEGIKYSTFNDPATGKTVYLYQKPVINEGNVNLAAINLEDALYLYPDRLDIWMGLNFMYLSIGYLEDLENTYYRMFEQLKINDNKWYSTNNQPIFFEDPKENENQFVYLVDQHISKLFNRQTEESVTVANNIVKKLIEIFPNNSLLYNDLGISYFMMNDFDNCISSLKKSYELDNKNLDSVFNLFIIYIGQEDFDNAMTYADIIFNSDNDELKQNVTNILFEALGGFEQLKKANPEVTEYVE